LGPVSWSLAHRNDVLAAALLRRDRKLDADDCGAIYYALVSSATESLPLLIDLKANRKMRLENGSDVLLLHVAAESGNVAFVKSLLDRKVVDVNETAPNLAVRGGRDPQPPSRRVDGRRCPMGRRERPDGRCSSGNAEVVEELIRRGIDIRHRDGRGQTALDYATSIRGGQIEAILRSHGLR